MSSDRKQPWVALLVALAACEPGFAQWLDISEVQVRPERTEMGGARLSITYNLDHPGLSEQSPAYVFLRYRAPGGGWKLVPMDDLRGSAHGIVDSGGEKKSVWWGVEEYVAASATRIQLRVRGLPMARVPGGRFVMQSVPGGGYDESGAGSPGADLPTFFLARNETTVGMYVDYLNEVGGAGTGWHDRMADERRCGIIREGSAGDYRYRAAPGREDHPVTHVSWYDARAFLAWAGLELPTEAQWEKAYRGGLYLDGDETRERANPLPERRYPWGDEAPDAEGIHRCNHASEADGFADTAPVGSFGSFNGPYGIADMAGNVAEWTLDWYTTSYHADLDGYRMVRGGSWRAIPAGVDAVTGATQVPVEGSGVVGFRGRFPK